MDKLYEKIYYYTKNKQERYDIVKRQQKMIEKYKVENWLKTLIGELNG